MAYCLPPESQDSKPKSKTRKAGEKAPGRKGGVGLGVRELLDRFLSRPLRTRNPRGLDPRLYRFTGSWPCARHPKTKIQNREGRERKCFLSHPKENVKREFRTRKRISKGILHPKEKAASALGFEYSLAAFSPGFLSRPLRARNSTGLDPRLYRFTGSWPTARHPKTKIQNRERRERKIQNRDSREISHPNEKAASALGFEYSLTAFSPGFGIGDGTCVGGQGQGSGLGVRVRGYPPNPVPGLGMRARDWEYRV